MNRIERGCAAREELKSILVLLLRRNHALVFLTVFVFFGAGGKGGGGEGEVGG